MKTMTPMIDDWAHFSDDALHRRCLALLLEQAAAKTLSVTAWLTQPPRLRDAAGMIVLGQKLVSAELGALQAVARAENPVGGAPVPRELADFRVTVECINRCSDDKDKLFHIVTWIDDPTTRGFQMSRRSALIGEEDGARGAELLEENHPRLEADEQGRAELSLRDAWLCLSQAGEGCVYAKRPDHRWRVWRYREIPKAPLPPPTPKPPRKTFGEANKVPNARA